MMKIRQKILLYFSSVTILVMGIAFVFVYTLFAEYREEEFQDRLKEKITYTLNFLDEIHASKQDVLQSLDRLTINELYQEKMLLFDNEKKLIYSSIDDTKILFPQEFLETLTPENNWIEAKDGKFDVVAVCVDFQNHRFYGINKAYDTFGYTKLKYLKYVLIFTFISIGILIIIITFYISRQISLPLNRMAAEIEDLKFDSEHRHIAVPDTKDEIHLLAQKFNELMSRMNNAFSFQKHAVHHISHELKTPIAVLVSNFERMENEQDMDKLKQFMQHQKEDTRNLGDIINALLEISKTEAGAALNSGQVRVDDLIFDIIDEVKLIHHDFSFEVNIAEDLTDERSLTVNANERLLKAAFSNLIVNSISYSTDNKASIHISSRDAFVRVEVINEGPTITEDEKQYLFQHFFRGRNSKGKRGFGLGLVLINKVILLHKGQVEYTTTGQHTNIFTVQLPLD